MKNTEYNSSLLDFVISSDDSLSALLGMMDDLGLEITGVHFA